MAITCRPGVKKSAAETVLLMRCAAGVPLVQDRPLPSTARVQEVFATRMLMGLAVPAELQRRSA